MDYLLYYFWLTAAFLIFFYSAGQRDWRGTFFAISAALFLGLAFASWDIETTYVFYNETSGEIITYTRSDYSQVNSYLCLGMGMLSIALTLFKIWASGLAELRRE